MPHERQCYGQAGESMASAYLRENGYQILESNYRNRYGEIDLIARNDGVIVFIEVKSRRSARYGSAREAVSREKQKKISMVALAYLKANGGTRVKARFDVVTINSKDPDSEKRIEVIKNAFDLAYG